uniref:Uncharacterized protein n=1 Tax=Anguilla anguilla TaxID=7936 RepID=A0A0E9SJP5_ANGAN
MHSHSILFAGFILFCNPSKNSPMVEICPK